MTLRFETRVLDFPKDDASEGPRLCVLLAHKCSRHVTHGSGLKPNHSGWLGKPGQDVAMRYSQLRWFGSDGPQEILRTVAGRVSELKAFEAKSALTEPFRRLGRRTDMGCF